MTALARLKQCGAKSCRHAQARSGCSAAEQNSQRAEQSAWAYTPAENEQVLHPGNELRSMSDPKVDSQ